MDLWIAVAVLLLVVWAIGTFVVVLGGWVHLLLTLGVFLLIWRVVVRGTPPHRGTPAGGPPAGGGATPKR